MIDWNKWSEYADGSRDLTRRDTLKLLGGTAVAVDTVDDDDNMYTRTAGALGWMGDLVPDIKWQLGDVDEENGTGAEKTSASSASPTATDTATDEDVAWIESYDVESFTEDLYAQSDFSVDATNDFLETAYSDAGGEITEANIKDNEYFEVNDKRASLYGENPGLGYSEEFGETLKVLDNEEKLDDIVEDYVEQELV